MTYSSDIIWTTLAASAAALSVVGVAALVRRHDEHAPQHLRDAGEEFDPLRDLTETVDVAQPQHPLLHHCQGVAFESRVRPARKVARAATAVPYVEPLATPEPPADVCDYLAEGDRLQIIVVPSRSAS